MTGTLANRAALSSALAPTQYPWLVGNPGAAMQRLESVRGRLKGVANQNVSASFFRARAEIEHDSGRRDASERDLRALASLAEAVLQDLGSNQDRFTWLHELDRAYRGLVQVSLERDDPLTALNVWESYRASESRTAVNARLGFDIESPEKADSPDLLVRTSDLTRGLSQSTILTLIQMGDGVAAWRSNRWGVAYRWIPVALDTLANLAASESVRQGREPVVRDLPERVRVLDVGP